MPRWLDGNDGKFNLNRISNGENWNKALGMWGKVGIIMWIKNKQSNSLFKDAGYIITLV